MEKNVWKITPKNATGKSEKGYRGPMAQVVLAKDDEPVNSKVETGYMAACGQTLQGLISPNASNILYFHH